MQTQLHYLNEVLTMTHVIQDRHQYLLVDNISIAYGTSTVVDQASLTVGYGEIGCLLGPSGCGKTTLLRAIAGFADLQNGHIQLGGRMLAQTGFTLPPEQRQIGMVFQDIALFPHLNIAANIAFGLQHWPRSERSRRVDELLELIGMSGCQNQWPHALSGGQQQRIALARAIAPRPQMLLMDEPFSGLDAMLREALVPEVAQILRQEKISTLLVTHDQTDAFVMADKIAVMRSGQIQQWDTAYNIYHQPDNRFVADFIGEGDFLRVTVNDEISVQSCLGLLEAHKPHGLNVGQKADLFIRPDDVLLADHSPLSGRIISRYFRGPHVFYRLLLPDNQILSCFTPSHRNYSIGDNMLIQLDLDHLMLFPITDESI